MYLSSVITVLLKTGMTISTTIFIRYHSNVFYFTIQTQYIKQHHYGGVMVWALDLDDFSGSCGQGKYPLLHAINDELNNSGGGPLP